MKKASFKIYLFSILEFAFYLLMVNDCWSELKVVVKIWTEDLKLLTFQFCLFYGLLIIITFFKATSTKKNKTHVLSYIKLLLVFIEFIKTGNK